MIIVSNTIILLLIPFMVKLLKLPDKSSETTIKIKYMFYSQLINTGLVILLVEASFQLNIFGLINDSETEIGVANLFQYILKYDFETNTKYYDYTKEWFDLLGIKILMVMTFYNITPIMYICFMPLYQCFKDWRAKGKVL